MTAPDHTTKPLEKYLARTGASIHGHYLSLRKSSGGEDEVIGTAHLYPFLLNCVFHPRFKIAWLPSRLIKGAHEITCTPASAMNMVRDSKMPAF
jgi:hypothetical protein